MTDDELNELIRDPDDTRLWGTIVQRIVTDRLESSGYQQDLSREGTMRLREDLAEDAVVHGWLDFSIPVLPEGYLFLSVDVVSLEGAVERVKKKPDLN